MLPVSMRRMPSVLILPQKRQQPSILLTLSFAQFIFFCIFDREPMYQSALQYPHTSSYSYRDDILTANITVADFPNFRCVSSSLTVPVAVANLSQIWNDHGSGCDYDGSVWSTDFTLNVPSVNKTISGPIFAGLNNSYDAPQAFILDTSKIQLKSQLEKSCSPPEQVRSGHELRHGMNGIVFLF